MDDNRFSSVTSRGPSQSFASGKDIPRQDDYGFGMLWRADTWARIEDVRKHPRKYWVIVTAGQIPIFAIAVAATAVAAPTAPVWWAVAGFFLFIDCMGLFSFAMVIRRRRQAARSGESPPEGVAAFGQSKTARITARKVPNMVPLQVLLILAVDNALFLSSAFYLLEWYWLHRPLPNWVLFAAAGAFVLSIAIGVALRTVHSSRRQLALLRTRAVAVWALRRSPARRHAFLTMGLAAVAGYLVWFLLPPAAGHDDLAIFALVTIETVLFMVYTNFLSRPWTSVGIDRAKNE